MARLLSKLAKGLPLTSSDRESLNATPLEDLKALLKVSRESLHESAIKAIQKLMPQPAPIRPKATKQKPRIKKKVKKAEKHRKKEPSIYQSLITSPSPSYIERLSAPRGSVRTYSGGGCSPK
jgi:hypothetical protein